MHLEITTTGAVKESLQIFRRFLEKTLGQHPGIEFELQDYDWNDAWPQLVRAATDKNGPFISEVGAPWVFDFAAMNSLRPFSWKEVEAVGGKQAFFAAPWANIVMSPTSSTEGAAKGAESPPVVYALPARVDVRVIYYWKDMLEKAGVDPATAFDTPAQVEETLEKIRASGTEPYNQTPWLYHTHVTRSWVYNMASWIWACQGDFVDENGLPVFDQPEAIDGITAYFRLHRFLAPLSSGETVEKVFSERRAAAMVTPVHYHIHLLHGEDPYGTSDLLPLLGCAQLPGPAFVGGTSFVIWQHASSKATQIALDLLAQFLSAPDMTEYCYETHMLPSRIEGFLHPYLAADPFLTVLKTSIETGRTHHLTRLWMVIADRLSGTCRTISNELLQNLDQDERCLVEKHIHVLANRMRMSFSAGLSL